MTWISVKERLPEMDTDVLIAVASSGGGFVTMALRTPDDWLCVEVDSYGGYVHYAFSEVTHWQPLPAPPAAENPPPR